MWYLVWFGAGFAFGGLFMLAASLLAMASIDADIHTEENMR